VVLGSKQP